MRVCMCGCVHACMRACDQDGGREATWLLKASTGPPSHSEVEQFFTVLPWCLIGQQTNLCLHLVALSQHTCWELLIEQLSNDCGSHHK